MKNLKAKNFFSFKIKEIYNMNTNIICKFLSENTNWNLPRHYLYYRFKLNNIKTVAVIGDNEKVIALSTYHKFGGKIK